MHWYREWNNSYSDYFGKVVLTNMGGPRNDLRLNYNRSIWQGAHHGPYSDYFSTRNTVPFYQTRSPLTEALYWQGYERGQVFRFHHTQNINKYWNFSVKIQRLNSLGLYIHNQNIQSNLMANTHYKNEETGYEAYFYFVNEKMEIEEFGGIRNDTAFRNNEETTRTLVDVNIRNNAARADKRFLTNTEFFLDQKVRLGNFIKKDTADSTSSNQSIASLGVGHTTAYQTQTTAYEGDATGNDFYDDFFFSKGAFKDSIHYRDLENTLYITAEVGNKSKLQLKGGLRHLYTEYSGSDFLFTTSNFGLTSQLEGNIQDFVDVEGHFDLIATGPLSGAVDLQAMGEIAFTDEFKIEGSYQVQSTYPEFYQQYYRSNNFIWLNNFDFTTLNELEGGIAWQKENHLKLRNVILSDYVYFTADGNPAQADENVSYLELQLRQNFDFWGFLHQDNDAIYQVASSGGRFYPLPKIVLRNSLYVDFSLFDRALLSIIGVELNYFSSFDSRFYNPGLGRFQIKNEDPVGNYPLLDVFAQFKISKGKVFVKYEHANMGLNGYNFFAAPHYPLPDRVLRVGISWRFFN